MPNEQPALDPYVRFWIENGVEVAMLTAADFRSAMTERDRLRHDLGVANFDRLANAEKVARLRASLTNISELSGAEGYTVADAVKIANRALCDAGTVINRPAKDS